MIATTNEETLNQSVRTATASAIPERPISVCFLISSLEYGGAERQVVEMVRSFDRSRVVPFICSLSGCVPLASSLRHNGQDLCIVEKHWRFDFTTIFRVARVLRLRKADVVHAFLLDAEIVARLAAPLAGVPVVVASERNTGYVRRPIHKLALRVTQPLFDVMVANSHAGKAFNIRTLGLNESRIEVVANGVDVAKFRPDREAGLAVRAKMGIAPTRSVVAMVGSFKRQKGHFTFLEMAARLQEHQPNVFFMIVSGAFRENYEPAQQYEAELKERANAIGLGKNCLFLRDQNDMTGLYNACDVTVLLSHHEGTPNAVLESMACAVPVVVSDVADNGIIVSDGVNGYVVPAKDAVTAANRVQSLLVSPEKRLAFGKKARERAAQEFSLSKATARLEAVYRSYLRKADVS
jgi:glycosyltransferase involved in cell wall biosynthesis